MLNTTTEPWKGGRQEQEAASSRYPDDQDEVGQEEAGGGYAQEPQHPLLPSADPAVLQCPPVKNEEKLKIKIKTFVLGVG